MKTRFITYTSNGGAPFNGGGFFSSMSFLTPGLVLLLLGLVTLLAPQLILAVIAAFFLSIGGILLFAGYKFFQLKRTLERDLQRMAELEKERREANPFKQMFSSFQRSKFSQQPRSSSGHSFFDGGSYHEDGTEYEINGDTIEVMDADDDSVPPKKRKIIFH